MEGSVKERLKHFLSENKIKGSDFCAKIGVSSGFISGMRESIQPDKLKSIAIHYPLLDIGWLMTGMGQMQKNAYPEPYTRLPRKGSVTIPASRAGAFLLSTTSRPRAAFPTGSV